MLQTTVPPSLVNLQASRRDIAGITSWMIPICGPHGLRAQKPDAIRFRYQGAEFGPMATSLGIIEFGTDVVADIAGGGARPLAYNVSLPLQGEQELQYDGGRVLSDTLSGLVVSPHAYQQLFISGHCRKIMVSIPQPAMHRVLGGLLRRAPDVPLEFESRCNAADDLSASWWRTVKFLLEEMRAVPSLPAHVMLSGDMELLLIKQFLLAQRHNYSDEIGRAHAPRVPAFVAHAQRFIDSRLGEDIRLEDIERAAGVSRQRLFDAFREHLGASPMKHLKRQRLEAARRELLRDQCHGNVSTIALQCGFTHLGRFAADYRKHFQETPSQTIKNEKARRARAH